MKTAYTVLVPGVTIKSIKSKLKFMRGLARLVKTAELIRSADG